MSGFFDGGYSDAARTGAHTAYQMMMASTITLVGMLGPRRYVRLRVWSHLARLVRQ